MDLVAFFFMLLHGVVAVFAILKYKDREIPKGVNFLIYAFRNFGFFFLFIYLIDCFKYISYGWLYACLVALVGGCTYRYIMKSIDKIMIS